MSSAAGPGRPVRSIRKRGFEPSGESARAVSCFHYGHSRADEPLLWEKTNTAATSKTVRRIKRGLARAGTSPRGGARCEAITGIEELQAVLIVTAGVRGPGRTEAAQTTCREHDRAAPYNTTKHLQCKARQAKNPSRSRTSRPKQDCLAEPGRRCSYLANNRATF
jgi:hypothetical protein